MRKFTTDKIQLYSDAAYAVSQFNNLQKINSYIDVQLWEGKVPQNIIVDHFWGILDVMLQGDGFKFKNCICTITYSATQNSTGLKMKYCTDYEMLQIKKGNDALAELNKVNPNEEIINGNLDNPTN